MTETVTCPADGCDYSGVPKSVLGHYSGKRDGAHEGGYERGRQRLGLDDDGDSREEVSRSPEDGGGGSGGGGGGGGNPTFGDADPDSGSDDTEHDLPCGHESFDETEAPEPPFRVECSQCGDDWVVNDL